MRWLDDERGGVAVTVAILLVVLIGIGALVVDAGNLYWERRQLQNAADAGALAAAQDHVTGNAASAEATARQYASENNTRGAFVEDIFQPTPTSVTVETITGDTDGPGSLNSFLAGVLGVDDYLARASATASWGGIAGAATIPIAICEEAWNSLTGDGANLPMEPDDGFWILRIGVPPGHINAPIDCSNPGGGDVPPGGFGFLDADGNCQAHVEADGWTDGKTGNTPDVGGGSPCTATRFYDVLIDAIDNGSKLLIPIFDEYEEQGAAGRFHVIGFGALQLRGYTINAGQQHPTYGRSYGWIHGGSGCPGSASCLDLRFTDFVAVGGDVDPGAGGTEFGASVVRLIE